MNAKKHDLQKYWEEILGSGFVQVPNVLLKNQAELGLTPIQLNILLDILVHWRYQNEPEKMPFPRSSTIANRIGRKQRTVQREIRKLQKMQFIEREPSTATEMGYTVRPINLSGLIKKLIVFSELEKAHREETAKKKESGGKQNRRP